MERFEETEDDQAHITINPLDIPHVLTNVFQNLTVWNLRKCRLVCKYWCEEATTHLINKSKITFKTEQQVAQVHKLRSLGEFCQSFDISNEINLYSEEIFAFFQQHNDIVKSLDLSFHHEYGNSWVQDVFPKLTNLEELCINGRATFLYEDTTTLADLHFFPKLKFLFVYDSSYETESPFRRRIWLENIFQILLAATKLERIFFAPFLENRAKTFFNLITSDALHHPHVSHLHINHLSANPDDLSCLLKKHFPLKYLHLVLTNQLTKENLNLFLYKLRATLRELTLTFTDGVTCAQFYPIDHLDEILKLSLIGYDGPLMIANANKLQLFVISLPEPIIEESLATKESVIGVNRKLKELEIYDSKGKYNGENLRFIYNQFIFLKSLKMNNVDNELLRLIYCNLPNLEELHICFHKFYGVSSLPIDCGLCGIPEYRFEDFLLEAMDARQINHLRSYPWLGSLKNLRVLELELGHITDYGVILGIVHCPMIRKLILKNCDKVYDTLANGIITDRSIDAIANIMNLYYLKIEGYNDCFSDEAMQTVIKRLDGIETYFL